ncbi:MAG: thiolase family protein [Gammaproteobacteria bacterium]|nr:thiolase family protein [Gammaproteobacteria bacterium]
MRDVIVLGIGQTIFGKTPERTATDLGREAVQEAIKDCGINPKDIQVAYTARRINAQDDSQRILMAHGITRIEMFNVENACAGGSTAVRGVWKDIASGLYDVGIAIGTEAVTGLPKTGALASRNDLDAELGRTMPASFALVARRQMAIHGATIQDFARVSAKNHRHAVHNPFAQYRNELTEEEIINSRMISDPITLLQCCPNSDGAAAVIMCSIEYARKYTTRLIRLSGSSLVSGDYVFKRDDITQSPFSRTAIRAAYEMAGIAPEDINVAEIHDAFANEEILRYEDLKLCEPGEGVALLRSGATELGGRVPVNPSGGLLSLGHPLSASGVRVVVDITRQLRGRAGGMQVENAKVGVAHMLGGSVTGLDGGACGIHVLVN